MDSVKRSPELADCPLSAHDSIRCDQSAVSMRLCARLTGAKLTLLPRSGTASWTTDGEYLFWA